VVQKRSFECEMMSWLDFSGAEEKFEFEIMSWLDFY